MSTQNVDIKQIAKLPSVKSWKSWNLPSVWPFAYSAT